MRSSDEGSFVADIFLMIIALPSAESLPQTCLSSCDNEEYMLEGNIVSKAIFDFVLIAGFFCIVLLISRLTSSSSLSSSCP